jgi:ribonuclease E
MPAEAMVETPAGFATEPDESRDQPRRDDRRRRRGRRGGRRNRQRNGERGYAGSDQSGHYEQDEFAPADHFTAPAAAEPERSHAVADLDSPPPERAAPPERSAPADASPAMSPATSPAMPPAAVEQPETARRRSTVREPAPGAGSEAAGKAPVGPAASQGQEPVVTETGEASESERPRRTGWWSRRFG